CGSVYTPAHLFSPMRAMSATTSIAPPVSLLPATAGRCSSRPRPRPLSSSSCATWASIRFKDLSARERVFQLGQGDFLLLKTLYQTNLPTPQTPFLGREKELLPLFDGYPPPSLPSAPRRARTRVF